MAAVLFLIFNRPDLTERVFDAIREARPERLYIAADGPRPVRKGEAKLCESTRLVTEQIDWPCIVQRLYRIHNLGCKNAVNGAISWFFDHEEEGIILEDDCLPHPDFFTFCDTMLAHYKRDHTIGHICGTNFVPAQGETAYSHYLVPYAHNWGWATWRRVWKKFDEYPLTSQQITFAPIPGSYSNKLYWVLKTKQAVAGEIDTWDYQSQYLHWLHGHRSVLPVKNLVSNIGFDPRATHTREEDLLLQDLQTHGMPHFETIAADDTINKIVERNIYLKIFRRSPLSLPLRLIKYWKHLVTSGG